MQLVGFQQALCEQRRAAGPVHVERDVASAGAQVSDQWGLLGDAVEVVDAEFDAGLAGEREQVQHDVGRAAGRGGADDAVLERVLGQDVARLDASPEHVHNEPAGRLADVVLAWVGRADRGGTHWREAEELQRGRHGVGGVLRAACAGAGAGVERNLMQFFVVDCAGGVLADRFEHVLNGEVTAVVVASGRDGTGVERDGGNVDSRHRHGGGGDGLVAAADDNGGVEGVADGAELDRVGDDLARDERGFHALGAHRDAVGDRDGVDLHRGAAGLADTAHDVLRELTVGEVAGHRADPRVRNHHQWLGERFVVEADGVELGSGGGAIGAVDKDAGTFAEVVLRGHVTACSGRALAWFRR